MTQRIFSIFLLVWLASWQVFAQSAAELSNPTTPDRIIDLLRHEAQTNSQVMDYAFYLTDVYGPRLTGSPAFRAAGSWAQNKLVELGLQNVRLQPLKPLGFSEVGWSHTRYAVNLIEPQFAALIAAPVPWSPGTNGRVIGEPIYFSLPGRSGLPLDEIIAKYRGKLKGKILLLSDQPIAINPPTTAPFRRMSDSDLQALREPPPPTPAPVRPPTSNAPARAPRTPEQVAEEYRKLFGFLRDEGVVGYLGDTRGEGGALMARGPLGPVGIQPPPPPGFNLPAESYNRILRLMQRGLPVRIEVELESTFHDDNGHFNLLGEIPGSGKSNEIVLVGAHLDSWHVGTGATDNAGSCAVLMEAMGVLKKMQAPLARTVRIALWGGHERGIQGSKAYLSQHLKEGREDLYLYLNMDAGAGRIRGIQLQQRQDLLSVVEKWLTPFRASGSGYASVRKSLGSDQYNFDQAGLPNMVFMQDPTFDARTYHSTMDVYDYLIPDDLKQSVALVAAILYQAANEQKSLKPDATNR
jgi:carboxypeptidase Q